jgi:hypothetical protein
MAIQTDDRIVVDPPARRRRRNLIFGIAATLLGAGVVANGSGGTFGLVIGLILLVFFGPVTLVMLGRALSKNPVLVLDADGFTDNASLISAGYVSWQDVQRIEERPFRRRVFVAITVTDRAAFLAGQSAWHRFLHRINGPTAAGDILIPDNVLPMSPAALVKTMRQMQRAALRRSPSEGTGRKA